MSEAGVSLAISERAFQDQVIQLATTLGYWWYHVSDSRRDNAGWPDLVLIKPPRLLIAELKRERGRLTWQQSQWLTMLRECGVETYLWRPSDWDEICRVLGGARVETGERV